jgi:hypothetical protein
MRLMTKRPLDLLDRANPFGRARRLLARAAFA